MIETVHTTQLIRRLITSVAPSHKVGLLDMKKRICISSPNSFSFISQFTFIWKVKGSISDGWYYFTINSLHVGYTVMKLYNE